MSAEVEALQAQLVEAQDRIRDLEREGEIRDEAMQSLRRQADLTTRACDELRDLLRQARAGRTVTSVDTRGDRVARLERIATPVEHAARMRTARMVQLEAAWAKALERLNGARPGLRTMLKRNLEAIEAEMVLVNGGESR